MGGISEMLSDRSTGFLFIRRQLRYFIELVLPDCFDLEDGVIEYVGVAMLSKESREWWLISEVSSGSVKVCRRLGFLFLLHRSRRFTWGNSRLFQSRRVSMRWAWASAILFVCLKHGDGRLLRLWNGYLQAGGWWRQIGDYLDIGKTERGEERERQV